MFVKFAKYIIEFLIKSIEDILILGGLILIITAAFLLNKTLGIFITGIILFCLGVYFSKYPLK